MLLFGGFFFANLGVLIQLFRNFCFSVGCCFVVVLVAALCCLPCGCLILVGVFVAVPMLFAAFFFCLILLFWLTPCLPVGSRVAIVVLLAYLIFVILSKD